MSGPIEKKNGLAHLFAAAAYSAFGFRRMLKETAFRHELLYGVFLLGLLVWAAVPMEKILVAAILLLVLFAVEALNTAIEELTDRVSPEISDAARNAKDLGSFAVFCLLVANAGYCGFQLWLALG